MFQELNKPRQDASGFWIAQIKGMSGMHYVLVDKIDIGYLMDHNIKDFFFEKESQCHNAAAAYYSLQGGLRYPYIPEWEAAIKREKNEPTKWWVQDIPNEPESETMEFI